MAQKFTRRTQAHPFPRSTLRHSSRLPRRNRTQSILRHQIPHLSALLVARFHRRYSVVYQDLSPLPNPPTLPSSHSPYSHHSRPYLRQSLHRHHAYATFRFFSIHSPSLLLTHLLSRVSHASFRDSENVRRLDFRRYSLQMGFPTRNR